MKCNLHVRGKINKCPYCNRKLNNKDRCPVCGYEYIPNPSNEELERERYFGYAEIDSNLISGLFGSWNFE